MMSDNEFCLVNIEELLERTKALDSDLLIIQDREDTKKITLHNLIASMVKDDELPDTARLYSSKKLDRLINDLKTYTEESIGKTESTVKDLQENSVTKKEFNETITELDNRKLESDDLDPINNTLAGKRNINTPIKSSELDTSDDEYKIKMANLSEEVLNAIAGDAPVSMAEVPVGGWVSRHIANRAIISTKLGPYYRYRGFITEDSVNTIKDDGIYLLGPNVKDLPKYVYNDSNLRVMEVTRFGESGNYIKQEIDYYDNTEPRPRYVRKGVADRIQAIDFCEEWDITTNFKVDSHLLDAGFDNKGIIEKGNIFDIEESGSYYIMDGVTGTPDVSKAYTLVVTRHGNTIVYQLKEISNDYALSYVAEKFLTSNGIPSIKGWHNINKINKSKFDGERLLIFGDGISLGVGASNFKNSYAQLLKSEYGFTVWNNSLAEATVGNYGDSDCTNRSVLTQIGECSLNDNCKYSIIFAGTEDWFKAKGEIGKINDFGDTTFYGAMNKSIRLLTDYVPTMKILLVTPLFRSRQEPGDNLNCDDYPVNYTYLSAYRDAIINIGKKYHFPVLNLFDNCCINKYNSSTYLLDGLYPNDRGHKLISEQIYNCMNMYF